ncbi:diguanylate cyclase [Aquabacterium fontiphilum]|uniref:GGDEF domain-containing protein n=1 Tax=Aquabacterium fontiphilum TaxID=450365 RepID=UPI0013779EFF|nr:GGDEF domain-containing protein [Aquabacterium fontiphilum]NBD22182.1 diguanylate cyclase [Aquabacterium fontiphilum]
MADIQHPANLIAAPLSDALLDALDQMGLAVTVKELASGRYTTANRLAVAWFGGELIGRVDTDVLDGVQAAALRAVEQQAQAAGDGVRAEHKLELRGERKEFVAWRRVVNAAEEGAPVMLSVWQDVTELRRRDAQLQTALAQLEQQQKANEALRREAEGNQVRDGVSGLYQRAHFEEQLRREADLSSREQREFALVSVAIDNMDEIMRLHGVEGCERVVESLGRLLRAGTRAMDSPCRLGGDRFVVLLSGVGLATAHSRMEQLRRQCAQHIVAYQGQQIPFTVSMGVASFPHTAGIVDELMRSADRALASAREKGGNRIVLASIQFAAAT